MAGHQLAGGVPRELAVGRKARDVVIDGAVDHVGVTALDQRLDQLEHSRHVVAGARVVRRRPDVHETDVVEEGLRVGRGDLFGSLLFQPRGDEHLVLAPVECVVGEVTDVGDVHHLLGPVTEVLEAAAEEVWEHERPQVADMRVAIDRRAAGVDPNDLVLEWVELLLAPCERVVQAHRGQVHAISILIVT